MIGRLCRDPFAMLVVGITSGVVAGAAANYAIQEYTRPTVTTQERMLVEIHSKLTDQRTHLAGLEDKFQYLHQAQQTQRVGTVEAVQIIARHNDVLSVHEARLRAVEERMKAAGEPHRTVDAAELRIPDRLPPLDLPIPAKD
jgi:uncharacterized coiled-coil protein SlyX